MQKISKAIVAVMTAIKGIEKNSNVGAGRSSYKGVKDQDVKKTLLPLMHKNGLSVLPVDIQETCEVESYTDQYGKLKNRVFVQVNAKYMLLHTSGESIQICGYGHGVDAADKAAGKATTYALKYALLYTFMIPVGEIDDTDEQHSDDLPKPLPRLKDEHQEPTLAKMISEGKNLADLKQKVTLSAAQEIWFTEKLAGAAKLKQ